MLPCNGRRDLNKASHMSFKTPDLLDNNEARTQDGSVRVVAPMFQHYGGRPGVQWPDRHAEGVRGQLPGA
jgi:hypothetical protein